MDGFEWVETDGELNMGPKLDWIFEHGEEYDGRTSTTPTCLRKILVM